MSEESNSPLKNNWNWDEKCLKEVIFARKAPDGTEVQLKDVQSSQTQTV